MFLIYNFSHPFYTNLGGLESIVRIIHVDDELFVLEITEILRSFDRELEFHVPHGENNHLVGSVEFRGSADKMLVLKVDDNGEWKELYFGDFDKVKEIANYSRRDNKYMITISKIRALTDSMKEKITPLPL